MEVEGVEAVVNRDHAVVNDMNGVAMFNQSQSFISMAQLVSHIKDFQAKYHITQSNAKETDQNKPPNQHRDRTTSGVKGKQY
jgi:hypothetical protein